MNGGHTLVRVGARAALVLVVASSAGCFDSHYLGGGPGPRADGSVDFDGRPPFRA